MSKVEAAKKIATELSEKAIKALKSDNSMAKKAAAATAGTAAVIAPSGEAEAAPVIPRKTLDKLIKAATKDGILDAEHLLTSMGIDHKTVWEPNTVNKLAELNAHVNLNQLGLGEHESRKAFQKIYPELEQLNPNLITENSAFLNSKGSGVLGAAASPRKELRGGQVLTDPESNKLLLNSSIENEPLRKTGVLLHEGEHGRDSILYPNYKPKAYPSIGIDEQDNVIKATDDYDRVLNTIKANPPMLDALKKNWAERYPNTPMPANLTDADIFDLFKSPGGGNIYYDLQAKNPDFKSTMTALGQRTGNHHLMTPINYEIENVKKVQDKGLILPHDLETQGRVNRGREQSAAFRAHDAEVDAQRAARRKALGAASVGGAVAAGAVEGFSGPTMDQLTADAAQRIGEFGQAAGEVYDKAIVEPANKAGRAVADLITPKSKFENPEAREKVLEVGGFMGEMGLDPTSLVAPGAKALGAAGILAKAGKGAELAAALQKMGKAESGLAKTAKLAVVRDAAHAKELERAAEMIRRREYLGELEKAVGPGAQVISKESTQTALQKTGQAAIKAESEMKTAKTASKTALEKGAERRLQTAAAKHAKERGLTGAEARAVMNQFILSNKSNFGVK